MTDLAACPGCGASLRASWRACPECGRWLADRPSELAPPWNDIAISPVIDAVEREDREESARRKRGRPRLVPDPPA